jgi:hypothetical protein
MSSPARRLAIVLLPLIAVAALPGGALAADTHKIVARGPAPPPPDPSHVPKQPVVKAAVPVAKPKPYVSEWRKAYIARTGHEPGKAAPRPVAARPPAHKPVAHAQVAKKRVARPIHRYRRCT